MFKNPTHITKTSRTIRAFYSSLNGSNQFAQVNSISGPFTTLNIEIFRQNAFIPEKPLLITSPKREETHRGFPAAAKWFTRSSLLMQQNRSADQHNGEEDVEMNRGYLDQFQDTMLPYEYITSDLANQDAYKLPPELLQVSEDVSLRSATFHRFHAPLQLFLSASSNSAVNQLYIAQAQLIDLPHLLRADLPTPSIVQQAGKGDIYDSNIWLGCPPTYTPLHKDPNPNLFVQLASLKAVRVFEPSVGREIFARVKKQLGESGREGMRGAEMMEGKERELLDEAVWGREAKGGVEAVVRPMDALFIPKGWWHSIKSVGLGVNASVNWWFR